MTKLGSRKLHICPEVAKMGSINIQKIDYNGVGALRRQRPIPGKNLLKYTPGVFTLFPPVPPCPRPALGESKEIPSSFFIIQSPEMFYFWLKSFNFNDVIIIEISCFGELSLVVTRASWSFVVTRVYY